MSAGLMRINLAWCLWLAMSLPGQLMAGERHTVFNWQQDGLFNQLEVAFTRARALPVAAIREEFDTLAAQLASELETLALPDRGSPAGPPTALLLRIEELQFRLGALAAAHIELLPQAQAAIHRARLAVLEAARYWPLDVQQVRDAVYRVIYGGRNAIEEALNQNRGVEFPALSLLASEDMAYQSPAVLIEGVRLYSGDIILSRGGAPTSALIARGNVYPGNFSHVAMLYVDADSGKAVVLQSLIEAGAVITSVEDFFAYRSRRLLVLRLRGDHPVLKNDPLAPHRAASTMRKEILRRHIGYDFALDWQDPERMFCAEVPYHGYRGVGVELWRWRSHLDAPGLKRWLGDLGVRHFETIIPADIEYDPSLVPVAEWRDLSALRQDRLDNAVLDVLLEEADRGLRIDYRWYKYPFYVLVKGWSWLVDQFGVEPPIPEGMSIEAALRVSALVHDIHPHLYQELEAAADAFREQQGYAPPYWDLLELARAVLAREKASLPLR